MMMVTVMIMTQRTCSKRRLDLQRTSRSDWTQKASVHREPCLPRLAWSGRKPSHPSIVQQNAIGNLRQSFIVPDFLFKWPFHSKNSSEVVPAREKAGSEMGERRRYATRKDSGVDRWDTKPMLPILVILLLTKFEEPAWSHLNASLRHEEKQWVWAVFEGSGIELRIEGSGSHFIPWVRDMESGM